MRKDYNLEKRKYVIGGFIVVLVCIYVVRLFMLQIMDDSYKDKSDGNAYVHKMIYPSRGLIFDRNGKLIVFNSTVIRFNRDFERRSAFRYRGLLQHTSNYPTGI